MFGKLISEETEAKIGDAVQVATWAKAIESLTAAMSHASNTNTPEGGELATELRTSVDAMHYKLRKAIGTE